MAKTGIDSTCCWICGRDVSLKDCKTDEHGRAVHEECYVTRTRLESETLRVPSTAG